MGRRTNLRLAQPKPPAGQRFRGFGTPHRRRLSEIWGGARRSSMCLAIFPSRRPGLSTEPQGAGKRPYLILISAREREGSWAGFTGQSPVIGEEIRGRSCILPLEEQERKLGHPTIYPTGVTLYNPAKAWSGYTLFPAADLGALLIDMNGKEVQLWRGLQGFPNKLLPDGQVFGSTGLRHPDHSYQDQTDLVQVDWEGNIVWRFSRLEHIVDPGQEPR